MDISLDELMSWWWCHWL